MPTACRSNPRCASRIRKAILLVGWLFLTCFFVRSGYCQGPGSEVELSRLIAQRSAAKGITEAIESVGGDFSKLITQLQAEMQRDSARHRLIGESRRLSYDVARKAIRDALDARVAQSL